MADLSCFNIAAPATTSAPAPSSKLPATFVRSQPGSRPGRTAYAFTGTAILADVSGSMTTLMGDGKRRIDALRGALADVHRVGMRLVAFGDEITELASPAKIPDPGGPTLLHLAIDHVLRPPPSAVLVITDGRVGEPERALRSAEALPAGCTVSALYVGREDDAEAIGFLRKLCDGRGGRVEVRDLRRLLPEQTGRSTVATAIRGLLT